MAVGVAVTAGVAVKVGVAVAGGVVAVDVGVGVGWVALHLTVARRLETRLATKKHLFAENEALF